MLDLPIKVGAKSHLSSLISLVWPHILSWPCCICQAKKFRASTLTLVLMSHKQSASRPAVLGRPTQVQ